MTNSPYYAKELMSEEGMIIILNQNYYLCHLLWWRKSGQEEIICLFALCYLLSDHQQVNEPINRRHHVHPNSSTIYIYKDEMIVWQHGCRNRYKYKGPQLGIKFLPIKLYSSFAQTQSSPSSIQMFGRSRGAVLGPPRGTPCPPPQGSLPQ